MCFFFVSFESGLPLKLRCEYSSHVVRDVGRGLARATVPVESICFLPYSPSSSSFQGLQPCTHTERKGDEEEGAADCNLTEYLSARKK